ncbi:MAG: hypothetical protein AAFN10_13300 [Bacteroidota bacterium]
MAVANQHSALKQLLLRGGKFVLLLLLLDIVVGWGLQKWYFSQSSGKYHRITHALHQTEAEILFVGTSHAVRHFIPSIFSDSLGLSGYNLGARGQHLYYCDAMMAAILERYTPRKIVINIDRDLFYGEANFDKLSDLKPYYWNTPVLRPHIEQRGPMERFLLLSKLYTYNSSVVHLIRYSAKPQTDLNGYLPQYKTMPENYIPAAADTTGFDFQVGHSQLQLLEQRLVQAQAAGSELYFVISPIISGDYIRNREIEKMAARLQVPLWNYSRDSSLIGQNQYFGDEIHLNHAGAEIISKDLAHKIKNYSSPAKPVLNVNE